MVWECRPFRKCVEIGRMGRYPIALWSLSHQLMGLRLWKTSSGAMENVLENNLRNATASGAQVEVWVNYFYDSFI